jgi:hypothetical protein
MTHRSGAQAYDTLPGSAGFADFSGLLPHEFLGPTQAANAESQHGLRLLSHRPEALCRRGVHPASYLAHVLSLISRPRAARRYPRGAITTSGRDNRPAGGVWPGIHARDPWRRPIRVNSPTPPTTPYSSRSTASRAPEGKPAPLSPRADALVSPTFVPGIAGSPDQAWSPPRGYTHCRISAWHPEVLDDTARTVPCLFTFSGDLWIAPCRPPRVCHRSSSASSSPSAISRQKPDLPLRLPAGVGAVTSATQARTAVPSIVR